MIIIKDIIFDNLLPFCLYPNLPPVYSVKVTDLFSKQYFPFNWLKRQLAKYWHLKYRCFVVTSSHLICVLCWSPLPLMVFRSHMTPPTLPKSFQLLPSGRDTKSPVPEKHRQEFVPRHCGEQPKRLPWCLDVVYLLSVYSLRLLKSQRFNLVFFPVGRCLSGFMWDATKTIFCLDRWWRFFFWFRFWKLSSLQDTCVLFCRHACYTHCELWLVPLRSDR